jgi:protease I
MARNSLDGLAVAILVTDGFEQVELEEPREALEAAGAETEVVSPKSPKVKGWNHDKWGDEIDVGQSLGEADPKDYDALLLPGGVMNPDALRMQSDAVAFVKAFLDSGKPIAAICHGPWTLIEAGAVKGHVMTSWPSLKSDLQNAGAQWVDREVVLDANLVTSRNPGDIPAFNREMIKLFSGAASADREPAATKTAGLRGG